MVSAKSWASVYQQLPVSDRPTDVLLTSSTPFPEQIPLVMMRPVASTAQSIVQKNLDRFSSCIEYMTRKLLRSMIPAQPVCLSCGRAVQKLLNGSTPCLGGLRFWKTKKQCTVLYEVPIPDGKGKMGSMRPLPNYFDHLLQSFRNHAVRIMF